MGSILLLEDEECLNKGISYKLVKEGYDVFAVSSVKEGFDVFQKNDIDLIICDVMLEDDSGLDFCKKIRQQSNVRLIFLTALDQEVNIVMGYEVGADDYITKPFSLAVLVSKVHAMFRRIDKNINEQLESGAIRLSLNEMKVLVCGVEKELTKTEIKLLRMFMENPKQILTKNQIMEKVFDIDGVFADQNIIAVNIRRLRQKIEKDASNPVYIKNIRSIGYLWDKECRKN